MAPSPLRVQFLPMPIRTLKFTATPQQGKVSAILNQPADAIALLLIAHGAGTDMRHYFLEALSVALAEQRIATFRYNFPYKEKGGKGGPNGQAIIFETIRRALAAATQAAPNLPLFSGGKSFGGRMTSLLAAQEPLPGLRGLVFFGFPLHPAGKPAIQRADHLRDHDLPLLFLWGPRDTLALADRIHPVVKKLGPRASLHEVAGADHSFKTLKRDTRTEADVVAELAEVTAAWIAERR